VYFALIVAFTFFYVYVAFDPHQQADIIRKQGGFIPASARAAHRAVSRAHLEPCNGGRGALPRQRGGGAVGHHGAVAHQPVPLLRTTLLISVGVALETMRQIDSQLMMRNYEGFLK